MESSSYVFCEKMPRCTFLGNLTPPINQKKMTKISGIRSQHFSTKINDLNPGNQNHVSVFGTFQHQQDCVYGFSSLTSATHVSRNVKEWFLSKSGEANEIFFFILAENLEI